MWRINQIVRIAFFVMVALVVLSGAACAHDFIGDAWRQLYPTTSWTNAGGDLNNTKNTGCALCHTFTSPPGGASWNPYGLVIKGEGGFTKKTETDDSDSDPVRTLNVTSSSNVSGVMIAVSPNDNNNNNNGNTPFARFYGGSTNLAEINAGTQPGWKSGSNPPAVVTGNLDPSSVTVTLTAPLTTPGGNNFQKWQRDGADFSGNQSQSVQVTMDADHTMTAVYVTPSPGTLQFSLSSYSFNEGVGNATITITRTGGSNGAVGVTFSTSNGSATAGSDYTAVNQTVSFANGDTASKTVNVPIINDTIIEPNETVNLTLSNVTGGATLGSPSTATLTILNDDFPGTLQFSSSSYSFNEGVGNATIMITRTGGSSGAVGVTFSTSNSSAIAGSDYTAVTQTVSFANGDTANKTVNVPIINDSTIEPNETVNLSLSNATGGATLGSPSTAVLTIVDNDTPFVSINDVTVTEGNSGTTNAVFTVSLSSAFNQTINVTYSTANGTAMAGSDYVAQSGTLTFSSGQTTRTISVPIIGDTLPERNETFFVNLTTATGGAVIAKGQGIGRIINNDSVLKGITPPVDFDGDGKADIAVYRNGLWFIIRSSDGAGTVVQWGGLLQDIPVPGDYDGDGKTDVAVYRDGLWFIIRSSDGAWTVVQWGGLPQDIPVPGDYDGDGKTDVAVYRDGLWFIIRSSDGAWTVVQWGGLPQDIPVPGDYDGDGKTDVAVYRDGLWFIIRSSDGAWTVVQWGGLPQDIPVPGDYDGDGKTDVAVYRDGALSPSLALWFIIRSSDGAGAVVQWGGLPQDIPVPGDYDGDGKTDVAVYRDGLWFIIRSSDGAGTAVQWGGLPQDIPLNSE